SGGSGRSEHRPRGGMGGRGDGRRAGSSALGAAGADRDRGHGPRDGGAAVPGAARGVAGGRQRAAGPRGAAAGCYRAARAGGGGGGGGGAGGVSGRPEPVHSGQGPRPESGERAPMPFAPVGGLSSVLALSRALPAAAAEPRDGSHDFDFAHGKWKIHVKK